ncbi:MAG: TrkH family potassium uptake protein [Clostridia bacterium]|nr:TrkH family potassium uptake protein [Clostridia bacterium]MDD4665922.1 TrkH family potassium uptake protein [Clostridia bacterium]
MNYQRIIFALSIIIMLIGLAMVFPLLWSLYYGDFDFYALLLSSSLTFLVGLIGYKKTKLEGNFLNKEVFCIVTLGWLLASFFGSLPYLFAGVFSSFADAFFETMSGFTTTGATVLTDIEALPHGILFWRSLTHWLGGMGIIVLFVALFPSVGIGGMQMFQAEAPGGSLAKKLKPRISETAKILWSIYLIMTMVETALLYVLGMPFFDALCHTFGTVATGGFSTKNASIGYYNNVGIQWVITIFMFLAGANFALYYQVFRTKKLEVYARNSEFKLYSFFVVLAIFLVTCGIYPGGGNALGESIRQAAFQVVSIITTTGYGTADFAQWPYFTQTILVVLMFIGGCAGSTGGAIKVARLLVLIKEAKLELQRTLHPRAILDLKIDGKSISQENVVNILQFFFLYLVIVSLGTIFMTLGGLDLVTAFTSVVTTLGNVGPGLAMAGPTQNYSFLPAAGKYFLSFLMFLGRLELYTVLVLFLPSFWRKG